MVGAQDGISVNDPVSHIGKMNAVMHASAVSGNTIITALMKLNPDLSLKDSTGRTALHYACRAGNVKTVKVLLDAIQAQGKTELKDIKTNGGITPLMAAAQSGNIGVVEMCLQAGCDPV